MLLKESDHVEQVKGITYSLKEFLGDSSSLYEQLSTAENNLYFCVLYLAPGDYHHFHSPTNWEIEKRKHFPGHLFPVNNNAITRCNGLFAFNERVVFTGKWQHGFFAMAPIGAYNVGSMSFLFDKEIVTNNPTQTATTPFEEKVYDQPIKLTKGDSIGNFNMGSTIVLIFEAPPIFFPYKRGKKLKLGERLVMGPYASFNETSREIKRLKENLLLGKTNAIEDVANHLEVLKQKAAEHPDIKALKQRVQEKISKKKPDMNNNNDQLDK